MRAPAHHLALLFVWFVFFAAGCTEQQSDDPLDWKISASTPDEFDTWSAENVPFMPEDLQREFSRAFKSIRAHTAGAIARTGNQVNNPLCERLHRKTVRQVLIEGGQLRLESIDSRVQNLMGIELKLLELSESANPSDQPGLQHRILGCRQEKEQLEQERAALEKRLRELNPASPNEKLK